MNRFVSVSAGMVLVVVFAACSKDGGSNHDSALTIGVSPSGSAAWPQRLVVTGGDRRGESWSLVAYRDHKGRHCLDMRIGPGATGGCGLTGFEAGRVSSSLGSVRLDSGEVVTLVSGMVTPATFAVRVYLQAGGTIDVPTMSVANLPVRLFGVPLDGSPARITGLDADGKELAAESGRDDDA